MEGQVVVARRFVCLELRRNAVGKKIGQQRLDVSLLMESNGVASESEFDTKQVMKVTFVFYFPSLFWSLEVVSW